MRRRRTWRRPLRLAVGRRVRHYRAAVGERDVALLIGAGVVSEIGDWFNTIALISLAYRFGDGALGVGGMLAVRMLARLVFQGPAGSFVDRHSGRRLLFAIEVVMAVLAGSFALLAVAPRLWLLYGLLLLLEMATTVARPAFMVQVKAAAPLEHRAATNGLLFAGMTAGQAVGPLLGAFVLAPLGVVPVFLVNGLTFLGIAASVTQLGGGLSASSPRARDVALTTAETTLQTSTDAGEAVGYRWLLRRRDLSLYAVLSLCLALLVQATIALFIVRANALGLGDGGVGVFFAAVAVGSIAGGLVAGAGSPVDAGALYRSAVAMGLCAVALAAFGIASTVGLAVVALVAAGFTTDFHEVAALTYFQHRLPDAVYGRFFSLFLLALSGGGLIGALTGPALERAVGVGVALTVLAVPGLALSPVLARASRLWRAIDTTSDD